ncbi:MAG: Na+/H+ antiporter NhaC [Mariniblastus sp.]|nr:Na+/H+ antiporter NhaC [Mariniblastus sp.]
MYVTDQRPETPFLQALFPILVLAALIVYGLILRPLWLGEPAIPLEIIFILAAALTVGQLFLLGYGWKAIQASIVDKLARALPAFFILFCIGLIIASWIVCGTIPMLVAWGLEIIDPSYLYLVAFLAPVIFSTLTGTSWGSVGTIGVVILGIATALQANLGITAGAIIGGAYFGDKMSPLSDTTNLAALAADVDLFEHIQSMMITTFPSALLAGMVYFVMGWVDPPLATQADLETVQPYLVGLGSIFHFSWLLLLPPAIVLFGSLRKMPTVPVLAASVIAACLLALMVQPFSITDVVASMYQGFNTATMVTWVEHVPPQVSVLLDRGGLYALNDAIITAFMVFVFIGAMDHIRAMPTVVNRLLSLVHTARTTILTTLVCTGITNALTSNQYATSFIVGDAFKNKYDRLGIPRKVLSRSLEDAGTMIESVIPWTATSLFMVATLGVPFSDYWHWQLLSLINLVVAAFLAITGIGCFLGKAGKASVDQPNAAE